MKEMKKTGAIICLCAISGCIFVGAVIVGIFHEGSNQQPSSIKELTDKEKSKAIKIAFEDERIKEMLKGKEYSISYVNTTTSEQYIEGKSVLNTCPVVEMYIGGSEWVTKVEVIVDLDEGKIMNMLINTHFKPMPPRGVTEEERVEAIEIALNHEIVNEKIAGLPYEIPWVNEIKEESKIKRERPGERLVMVNIGIVGTMISYSVSVSLTERRVIYIAEDSWGGKMGQEKSDKAYEIAENDPWIKEKIEKRESSSTTRQRLVGEKLLVDVYIQPKGETTIIVATIDIEEEKVIGITESASWPESSEVIYTIGPNASKLP
ncbi:MAG: hypothetical protein EFT35_03295 [Methanophagales archaeon ANME-1-THS]|nr:MAG: hypothetical protein EFT35_03295 [Methanophagales archaeon ANME-1-THS]